VQTGTAYEQIPQKLNNMPFDQWRHVYDTLDQVSQGRIPGPAGLGAPADLQTAAAQAKNELAGSLAREVQTAGARNAGAWNANAANNVLNARAQKLGVAMDPEEQQAFHTLNYGGQFMPNTLSYEGAAQQARRMGQAGLLERTLPQVGATIGGAVPIPGGTWAGGKAGEWAAGKISLRRLMNQARDLDAQMESNAKLGNQ
jgi:hypothetical protein